jgi:peptidyl-prolyl cis-trans isomerase C
MNRLLVLLSAAALALPAVAQQQSPAPAAANPPKNVAVINGEVLTADRFNLLWNNLGFSTRDSYEKAGGKGAFLDNYVSKRLLIQEAIKSGFDKRPDVRTDMENGSESALFDRYVRDVVAAPIVTEADVRKYYDEHQSEFAVPEKVKVRHIVITANGNGPNARTKEEALERIKAIATDLLTHNIELKSAAPDAAARLQLIYFADAARKYSEDASAPSGGDLGWHAKGEFDPTFEQAVWNMKPGMMSGIVETPFGYHLIFIEGRQPAGTQPYDEVRSGVREFLLGQKATEIMTAVKRLTMELRQNSKVTLFPENIK